MKKLLTLLIVLMWVVEAKADNLGPLTTGQYVQCEVFSMDSAGVDPIAAESLFIVVYDVDGDSTFGEIIDTSNVSIKGPYTRRTGNGATIIFYNWVRLVSAIDGDQGVGPYQISVIAYEDADETRWVTHHNFYLINSPLHALLDSAGLAAVAAQLALDSLRAQDGWVAQEASLFDPATDSVIVDGSALAATAGAIDAVTIATDAITNAKIAAGAVGADEIAPNAIGSSELATTAATKIADAVNDSVWQADFETYDGVAGSFGDSAQGWGATAAGGSDKPTAWLAADSAIIRGLIWETILNDLDNVAGSFGDSAGGWGATSASALDSTIVSNILHRIVWGTAVGSGSDSSTAAQRDIGILAATILALISDSVWDEILTGATHNIASSAGRRLRQLETGAVLLTGTINTANDSTATLGLSGDYPDGFFVHNWLVVEVGTDSVQIRQINGYTGATDSVDMAEAESWVINPVNGDAWEIVANTGVHVVDLHTPVVLQIVAAMYDKGIWIDDNSGNTNTEPGVDGTRANPVSTFTAARTIADALGYQKYYLVNNTSLTLAATHEDWDFVGVGESNEINFGGQDIDNSHFEHLMVAGTQGGTGLIWLNECYMDAADSLECVARNSWFSDTVSVRVATNIIFDNCFSAIPGNTTPAIDFNSAGGTISVNVRHYSGGMAFLNGTSNHTISYETDGQLVIDASCTSLNVTARGNMTITDNGTTTSLTSDAVYNKGYVADTTLNTAEKDSILAGLYDKGATSIAAMPFSTRMILGFPGASPGWDTLTQSVTNRIGSYAGTAGDNNNIKDDLANPLVMEDTVSTGDTLAVKKDSLIYQGAAGSIWAEAEKDSILAALFDKGSAVSGGAIPFLTRMILGFPGVSPGWDSLQKSIDNQIGSYAGTAGDDNNIKDDIDALSAGSGDGANACSIWVSDGSGYIQGVNVRLQASGGGPNYYDATDSDGKAIFALDDGTYYGYAALTGYSQDVIPDTFTFTSDYFDTLLVTAFTPTPGVGDLTTLYNWIVDGNDQGIKNVVVEAYIPDKFWPVKNANKAIRARHSVKTDSTGLWELPIFGNDIVLTDQGDSSSYWMVTAEDGSFKHKVTVSSDSSTQLMIPDDN